MFIYLLKILGLLKMYWSQEFRVFQLPWTEQNLSSHKVTYNMLLENRWGFNLKKLQLLADKDTSMSSEDCDEQWKGENANQEADRGFTTCVGT